MGMLGRLDRHAVARQHVEMRGPRKPGFGRLQRFQRCGNQAPFPPAAFDLTLGKGNLRIAVQCGANPRVICGAGAPVKVNRHIVACRRKPQGLGDDPFGILVTKQDEGDLRHRFPAEDVFARCTSLASGNLP